MSAPFSCCWAIAAWRPQPDTCGSPPARCVLRPVRLTCYLDLSRRSPNPPRLSTSEPFQVKPVSEWSRQLIGTRGQELPWSTRSASSRVCSKRMDGHDGPFGIAAFRDQEIQEWISVLIPLQPAGAHQPLTRGWADLFGSPHVTFSRTGRTGWRKMKGIERF